MTAQSEWIDKFIHICMTVQQSPYESVNNIIIIVIEELYSCFY